ncbi:MAG: NAD-dependent epimerase/dehydratase family protein [Desulfobacterales bacterium]
MTPDTRADKVVARDLDYIRENLEEELRRLAGKRILITGGAGFLGYYLVQTLLRWNRKVDQGRKINVTVLDNFIRGVPAWLNAVSDENCTLRQQDIIQPLPESIGSFAYIVHAASIASPTYYRKFPIETIDANVTGLRLLLDRCRDQEEQGDPIEGFLFFSSSEVYGNPTPENIPTPETYLGNVSFTGPRACYDESKRFGETLCVNFARQHGLPIRIARPFNNYGPGLRISDRRVVPDFAMNIFQGMDIIMLSDGTPTRTFCYVADAVIGYYKILTRGRAGEAYNIGVESPEISMFGIAGKMIGIAESLFGYSGKVIRQQSKDPDYLVDNPNRRCPVIEKARTELGYRPSIDLDEGLARTLLWYRDNLEKTA